MTRSESLRPQLEGFVARVQRETRVPGIGVAVIQDRVEAASVECLELCASA